MTSKLEAASSRFEPVADPLSGFKADDGGPLRPTPFNADEMTSLTLNG